MLGDEVTNVADCVQVLPHSVLNPDKDGLLAVALHPGKLLFFSPLQIMLVDHFVVQTILYNVTCTNMSAQNNYYLKSTKTRPALQSKDNISGSVLQLTYSLSKK